MSFKKIIALSLFAFSATSALAQAPAAVEKEENQNEATTPERTHDVSFFQQSGGPLKEGEGSVGVIGATYRWAKPRSPQTFWKIGFGVGSSFAIPVRRTQPVSSDSAFNIEFWRDERVYLALGAVETQRRLWKGIYLTAGAEVQAGGSSGQLDSVAREIPDGANTVLNGAVIGSPAHIADTRQFF